MKFLSKYWWAVLAVLGAIFLYYWFFMRTPAVTKNPLCDRLIEIKENEIKGNGDWYNYAMDGKPSGTSDADWLRQFAIKELMKGKEYPANCS